MMSYASSSRVSQGYDVFLSFRGEDTRAGFISHLYEALVRKRIKTYKDDRALEIGNLIAPELLEAIEASIFAIVVLSSNYATSKWCLEEITKVVDCMERGNLIVIPVFYHVLPSDVRRQSNCFEQGFANHELDPEIIPTKVAAWRSALAKVGSVKGLHVTPDKDESDIIGEILRRILQDIQDASSVDLSHLTKGLVGIECRLHEVIRILNMESSEVRFIGICGMSGIGKTTLAEVVFESIRNTFQESCFIGNIKDISKEHDSDLCKLQQKILDDALKDESIPVRSVKHGQTLLMTKLRDLKVIIVLDDVNHADQLMYLAGGREWFGPSTRIIVTTTNADLLNQYRVNEIYTCEELKDEEALGLFCQSAFVDGHPTHGYEKLCDDIVKYSGGLPIALTIYGSLLCGKEERYWKEILRKVQEYPHKEVLGRLEVGYVRLDRHQQQTFMYIACFLKGRDIDLVKDILTDIGLYPECGITDLINKFLITINIVDCVWMHDLLQQMCWEILRKESHQYNGKQIAIKYRQDVLEILSSQPKGSRTIEIINQESYKVEVDDCINDPSCFSKMTKLKFLRISNIHFPQGLNYLSNDLRILEWYGCSLKSLPSTFEPKHIYQLEMCYSKLETLWEKNLDLPNLRSIDLSFSKDLTKIPDLTSTPNLVKLSLKGCIKLKGLHKSVLSHKRLQFINLSGCTVLQSLGTSNMEMEALVTLILSGCSNLEHVPEFGLNMKCLENLYVDGTNIKKLPESLGGLCNLRKLDASETSIQEIPLSIRCLKSLRLLRVYKCRLLSQSTGFLFTRMDVLSRIRELDLSYCNLYVVPNCIGLLHRLVNLDLSGNNFASLPANIGLLSNLRMLCFNNCKRLHSLPKLSVVNEDTLYGLQLRFNYIISEKKVDASKFHATSYNTNPTVSCLNCPKVAENEIGYHMAERIVNSYLQSRTNYCITPEAIFEIVGAGKEIPLGFKRLRSDESLTLKGPWIGVVICAVVASLHTKAAMEAKYVVTAHIHVGEKYWKVPVPINLLATGLENQLVFYWTRADDLQRIVTPNQESNFKFSFSMEPRDCKLQVSTFGVRIIHEEDITQLKKLNDSITKLTRIVFDEATSSFSSELQWYLRGCKSVTFTRSYQSLINHDLTRSLTFICDYGKQQYTLDDMHKIIKCLIEINEEVLSGWKEDGRHAELFPLVYDYYQVVYGTSVFYKEFLRLLKDACDSWLSVKLALEQIVEKSRTDKDYSYKEMLEQLYDLEAAKSIRFCDNFITSFAFLCKQSVSFSRNLNEHIQDTEQFKTLAKVSSITNAVLFSILATYMCSDKLSQEMKGGSSYSIWLRLIRCLLNKTDEWFPATRSYRRELLIQNFSGCAVVVQKLKMKMSQFASFSRQSEMEMMTGINKLEKMMDNISMTIEDMCRHAHIYSLDIREAGITLNQFIVDSNLRLSVTGVRFIPPNEEHQYENPVSEAMAILYQATLSVILTDLQWYIHACEEEEEESDDSSLLSCHFTIYDSASRIIKIICDPCPIRGGKSVDDIHKVITRLHSINQKAYMVLSECKEEWRHHSQLFPLVNDYHKICLQTFQLYYDFVRSLKGQCDSRLSVISRLREFMVRQDFKHWNFKQVMIMHFNEVGNFTLSDDFVKSLACICKRTVAFTRRFHEEIQDMKLVKALAKVSSGLIVDVFSVMASCMVDCTPFQWMEEKSLTRVWLHLIRSFSWKSPSPSWKGKQLVIKDFFDIDSFPQKSECRMGGVNKKYSMFVINSLQQKIDKLSVTIEDMSRHACIYSHDISKAGISLELISHNHISDANTIQH